MTEYAVKFGVTISAKSKDDLYRKAEKVAQQMSMCVGKKVYALEWGELETKKVVKTGVEDDMIQNKKSDN